MSELGPDARSILDAARARERPTETDRARARRSLMRALAAGGAAAAATAAGTGAAASAAATTGAGAAAAATTVGAVGTVSVAGKVIAILVLAGAVSAGVFTVLPRADAPADVRPPATSAALAVTTPLEATPAEPPGIPARTSPEPSAEAEQPAPAPSIEAEQPAPAPSAEAEQPAPSRAAAPVAPRTNPRAPESPASAAPPRAEDPLDVETRSLGEAHGALQSGDPARALALLDRQSATHAQGELRQERAAARVVALCKLGRTGEARAAAESFLRENPRSPLTDVVRAACPPAGSKPPNP